MEAPAGFEEFVRLHSSAIVRTAWLLTGDSCLAEDLVQIALAEVWTKWTRISSGPAPAAYVRAVVVSRFLSSRRRRWWDEVPHAVLPEAAEERDAAAGSANRDALRRALAKLSPQQRAVVVLRFIEDFSVEQTAEMLRCSQATVKVQASRGLRSLREDPHLSLTSIGARP